MRRTLVWGVVYLATVSASLGHGHSEGAFASDGAITSTSPTSPGAQAAVVRGRELLALRDSHSRTWVSSDGTATRRLYGDPVNYKTAAGTWQPIANSMISDRLGGWVNRANSFRFQAPRSLEGGFSLRRGADVLRFRLLGSRAVGKANGAVVEYAKAMPGVDAQVTATGTGVKEDILLRNQRVRRSFTYELRPTAGLDVRISTGGRITMRRGGDEVFSISRPFVVDASGARSASAVTSRLRHARSGWQLRVEVERSWLEQPDRVFPVTIDPTVSVEQGTGCTISEDEPASSYCVGGLSVGLEGRTSEPEVRSLMQFDHARLVPAGADIKNVTLRAYADDWIGPMFDLPIAVHSVHASWDENVTWSHRTSSSLWSVPGGHISTPYDETNVPTLMGWMGWDITTLARGWLHGTVSNHGVALTPQADQATVDGNRVVFASEDPDPERAPHLEVEFELPRRGLFPSYVMEGDEPLDPGADDDDDVAEPEVMAHANMANGNLVVGEQDVDLAAVGPDIEVKRFYNSLDDSYGGGPVGMTGRRSTLTTGTDLRLEPMDRGPVVLHGPSAYTAAFERSSGGEYLAPADLDASLSRRSDGSYRLEMLDSDEVYEFSPTGRLTARVDQSGARVTLTYDGSGRLSTMTDAQSRVTTFTYGLGSRVARIVEPVGGAVHSYGYDAAGFLTTYTDPANRVSRYHYTAGRLTRVEGRDGSDTRFTYDARGKIASITNVTNPMAGTGSTTSFEYLPPSAPCTSAAGDATKTVVTRPDGSFATYCFDSGLALTSDDLSGLSIEDPGDPGPDDPAAFPELDGCLVDPEWPTTYCGGDALPHEDEGLGTATVNSFFRWGLSDQGAVDLPTEVANDLFEDRRFHALELTKLRRIVPWNVATDGPTAPANARIRRIFNETVEWVRNAREDGYEPLVSFEGCPVGDQFVYQNPLAPADPLNGQLQPCRGDEDGNDGRAPSTGQYAQAVEAFLDHPVLGQVNEFTAWNEPNHGSYANRDQPTWNRPFRAGQYWRILNELCRPIEHSCLVAAGDFQDSRLRNVRGQRPSQAAMADRLTAPTGQDQYAVWYWYWYRRGAGGQVLRRDAIRWAWHAYSDGRVAYLRAPANRWLRYKKFNAELATRFPDARVWATEQGVVLHDGNTLPAYGRRSVQNATMRSFVRGEESFVEQPRIARFYYYQFRGARPTACHDSGLLNPPRLSLYSGGCTPTNGEPPLGSNRRRAMYYILRRATTADP